MTIENRKEIYESAVTKWGIAPQMNMTIEECSELIKSICKAHRYGDSPEICESVIDEIADVTIMCEQMAFIFGEELVQNKIEEKLKRLEKRLE